MYASVFCQILYPLKSWLKQIPPWKWLIEVKSLCGVLCKDPGAASVLHLLGEKRHRNSECMVWCFLYPYSSSWTAAEAKIPQVQVRAAPWKTLFVHLNIAYTNHFLRWVCSGKYFPLVRENTLASSIFVKMASSIFVKLLCKLELLHKGQTQKWSQFMSLGQVNSANVGGTTDALTVWSRSCGCLVSCWLWMCHGWCSFITQFWICKAKLKYNNEQNSFQSATAIRKEEQSLTLHVFWFIYSFHYSIVLDPDRAGVSKGGVFCCWKLQQILPTDPAVGKYSLSIQTESSWFFNPCEWRCWRLK